jgi:hypothetical protein
MRKMKATADGTFYQSIERAIRNIEEDDRELLETLRTLKDGMNTIEGRVREKRQPGDLDKLNCAIESLNQLTDSQILASKKAWKIYEEFECESKGHSSEQAKLNELRGVCKKREQIAADLLCYSLGHLK